MKILVLFILLAFIGITEKASTGDSERVIKLKHQPMLKEKTLHPLPTKVKLQLHLLQANIKKYDAVITIEKIKDSITVLKDSLHVKQ